jgi:hypothetical protein
LLQDDDVPIFDDRHLGGGGSDGGGSGGGSGGDFKVLSSAPFPSLPYPVKSGDPAFPPPATGVPNQPQPRIPQPQPRMPQPNVSLNVLVLMNMKFDLFMIL